jgi:hypothetical protein
MKMFSSENGDIQWRRIKWRRSGSNGGEKRSAWLAAAESRNGTAMAIINQ